MIVSAPITPTVVSKVTSMDNQFQKMLADFRDTLSQWRLWLHLGWNDIATQYRRSFLGPLWITLSTGIFIIAFGVLGAQLFGFDVINFLPYFSVGFIFFTFLSTLITDACDAFQGSSAYLKHQAFPRMIVVLRIIVRNLVMLGHNLIILVAVLFWAGLIGQTQWLYWLLGFFLTLIAAVFAVAIVAIVAARFRDVPMMVRSIMQITFFLTPVFWQVDQVTDRVRFLIGFNPFAVFLELLRSPLLGHAPSGSAIVSALIVICILFLIFLPVFWATRRRLVHWV